MTCVVCGQAVRGAYMNLSGSIYHDSCTSCAMCRKSLFQEPFYDVPDSDKLYCEQCYISIAATKCHQCGQAITDGGITTMGKTYHSSCFCCGTCAALLPTGTPFYNVANMPTCASCAKLRIARSSSTRATPSTSRTRP